ncbi:YcxB family protein [Streptomyces sp. NRRL F-2799]|uniref:YcxB family protein n=1 Tax=Streptomyces sp. NRRL F-2799 TaxID=1463844 RepID=UPI0006920EC6|nr:YcxB family protein [Streptomyces sp. NRRL F-2799]
MVMDMGREAVREAVELSYRYEVRDFASAVRARRKVSRSARRMMWSLGLAFVAFALIAAARLAAGRVDPFALILMCYFGIGLPLVPQLQARALARTADLIGPCRATVTDDGLTIRAEHTTVLHSWGARPVYRETPEVFALFSGDRNARLLTLLPKRGLAAPADTDRLRAILDRHVARA